MHMVGDAQPHAAVPASPVQDEHNLLGGTRPDLLGEGFQLDFEEGDADGGRQMEDRPTRGRMDEADQIAPVIAVLHRRRRALAVETPDFLQDRFQADPVLIDGPEFDTRLRVGGGNGPQQRSYVFLNASCWAGSAKTWRGRGLRRLPSRRTR